MDQRPVLELRRRLPGQAADGSAHGVMATASVLHPPAARFRTVARQALLDQLAQSLEARLVLMAAPAGWGKTSVLRDWWLAMPDSSAAWLSLMESDNDPVWFWSGVIAALARVAPGTGAAALEALAAPEDKTPGHVESLLVNDLARMPGRHITLVLDDFHLITSPEVRAGFGFLVEHLPPTLSLVVAARGDPELPLARLRARGELAEIRADQLRFSMAEAGELLNQTLGLALAPEEIGALSQRTEGWAAVLRTEGRPSGT
jgi:LuxR family transcriptional regulator, maltose regulon positive regulatory protein